MVDAAPAGFSFGRTDGGRMGRWLVRAMADAPGGKNVLVQVDDDSTRDRYPVAVADEPILRDLRVSVRCKPLAGTVDRACGLVFRYRDANNYYVTRANALEDNVRLYYVCGTGSGSSSRAGVVRSPQTAGASCGPRRAVVASWFTGTARR
jgi:hypothetical protein